MRYEPSAMRIVLECALAAAALFLLSGFLPLLFAMVSLIKG